jgi:hypothetical protein
MTREQTGKGLNPQSREAKKKKRGGSSSSSKPCTHIPTQEMVLDFLLILKSDRRIYKKSGIFDIRPAHACG